MRMTHEHFAQALTALLGLSDMEHMTYLAVHPIRTDVARSVMQKCGKACALDSDLGLEPDDVYAIGRLEREAGTGKWRYHLSATDSSISMQVWPTDDNSRHGHTLNVIELLVFELRSTRYRSKKRLFVTMNEETWYDIQRLRQAVLDSYLIDPARLSEIACAVAVSGDSPHDWVGSVSGTLVKIDNSLPTGQYVIQAAAVTTEGMVADVKKLRDSLGDPRQEPEHISSVQVALDDLLASWDAP